MHFEFNGYNIIVIKMLNSRDKCNSLLESDILAVLFSDFLQSKRVQPRHPIPKAS
jgi:hypothetical protein